METTGFLGAANDIHSMPGSVFFDGGAIDRPSVGGANTTLGMILLSPSGTVFFADARARAFCEEVEGLSIEDEVLSITIDGFELRGLDAHQFGVQSKGSINSVSLAGKSGRLSVRFLPLADRDLHKGFFICLLRDEERELSLHLRDLCHRYRLSPSESKLCACLLEGHSLLETAAKLSTSYTAVKTRLKRIFEKTNIQRESDLIHMLVSESPHRINRRERD